MCRSFLSSYRTPEGEEKYLGRANLGVVSISLPMIALESTSQEDFMNKLERHMDIAFQAHMVRLNRLKGVKAKQNPIMYMYGVLSRLDAEEEIEQLFYNGYMSISIGYMGVAEMLKIFNREQDKEFAMKVLQFMKDKCEEYKNETNIAFSLYGSPGESMCYRFAKCIEAKYPGVLEHQYLTNSFHQPVWIESNPFEKWEYESGFANISNGGNIGYIETPNLANNIEALEALIDYGYKNIHYFGINQPIDKCYECEFEGEFDVDKNGFKCPSCGNNDEHTISVIRRVSGYLSAPNSRPYNTGKQAEVVERVKHNK